ncbi:MAG: ADP-ribosylglycohydrolase, partial [Chitinivibrionales bacterium]|nr:ADP-ribosylglycohydrolase [Chitinivibrionales bacterium]
MSINRKILENLFSAKAINLRKSSLFDTPPDPLPAGPLFDRIEGMMLGLAAGDALGITTEAMLPAERRNRFGEIRDYLPNRYAGECRGYPSDDTQLAFWTLEQMIEDNGFVPEHAAARFCRGKIFGIGSTVRQFIANYRQGTPWQKCGPESAGNGALM